jgi:predicted RNA-binding Zn ribbon-like protein
MSRDPARAATQFFGGRICLDFANTLDWRLTDAPQELIPDYGSFLLWSRRRGTLAGATTRKLASLALRRPAAAAAVMRQAHALRSEILEAAEGFRSGGEVDLAPFNLRLAALPPQPRLIGAHPAYVHDLPGKRLEEPLWPVLWSLTALLASEDAARLGACQAEGCGWLFVDESPNRSRLWCSSEVCGNRERARRAYAKRRAHHPP